MLTLSGVSATMFSSAASPQARSAPSSAAQGVSSQLVDHRITAIPARISATIVKSMWRIRIGGRDIAQIQELQAGFGGAEAWPGEYLGHIHTNLMEQPHN